MAEKRKFISNPYSDLPGYNCFGCSQKNQLGLRMQFFEEGEYVVSDWAPSDHLAGYKKILHGGIQATLLDEIASWCVQVKLKTSGVTVNIDLRYKKPVFTDQGNLLLKARIGRVEKNIAFVETELYNADNVLCCNGKIKYFLYPKKIAREKLYSP